VNGVEDFIARDHRGARRAEMQFGFAAIGTLEARGNRAFERQAATVAKGRLNKLDLAPAICAHETIGSRSASSIAKLAGIGVNQRQARAEEGFE
jgi:hypothetical protein